MEEVRRQLARIEMFQGREAEAQIERLGGLTNLVYKISLDGEAYILRIAGEGTDEIIDRVIEKHNARVAANAGMSADVLFFDASDGLMLASYIPGETMSAEKFTNSAGSAARAARAFKIIHTCGQEFKFRFELFAMMDDYLKVLDDLGATLPDGYHDVVHEAQAVRRAIDAHPADLVPCHCDPLCENFIDDGERMWIIDWEYSGMNDPLWDLGDLSIEAGFTEAQDREMMEAYFDNQPTEAQFARMVIYKAMADLLWTLWGLIQHANNNPVDDFWAYSIGRFERCKKLMASPEFTRHLEAMNSTHE